MKNKQIISILIGLAVLGMLLAGSPFYIVDEYNQAIITQFGKPVGDPKITAGLKLKIPFIQKVTYFDKRLMEWDGYPTQIPTKDKKYIWVDTTARWKIDDPLKFYQTVYDERRGQARLDDIIDATVRDLISSYHLIEIVRTSNRMLDVEQSLIEADQTAFDKIEKGHGREGLRLEVFRRAAEITPKYGIELVDIRIKRLNYVKEVQRKVYERMVSERKRAAAEYRSMGRGKKSEIEGKIDKELKIILSEAFRDGETIKGKADKEATDIYAKAYSADPEFFSFLKTMDAYLESANKDTSLIISTNSDYFSYLKSTD